MRKTGLVLMGIAVAVMAIVWWLWLPAVVEAPEVVLPPVAIAPPVVNAPRPRKEEPPAPALPSEARVSGRVRCDHEVEDLEKVEIDFQFAGTITTVKAEVDGSFVFTTSLSGDWAIAAVRAEKHQAQRTFDLTFRLEPGTAIEGVELRVDGSIVQRGRVVDVQGRPLAGARVSSMFAFEGQAVLSDERGEFSVELGGGFLVATHPCCFDTNEAPPGNDTKPFVITLRPRPAVASVELQGIVIDEDDRPVPGATIEGVARAGGTKEELDVASFTGRPPLQTSDPVLTRSDAQGRFSVRVPADSTVELAASLGSSESGQVEFEASATARLKLLAHTSAISGRVVDDDGKPVSTFELRFLAEEFGTLRTFHSADGRYRLDGLPSVVAKVEVSAPGLLDGRREGISIARGKERGGVDFKLESGRGIPGVVFDDKTLRPIAGVKLSAAGYFGRMKNGEAHTDPQGAFVLRGLAEGRIELSAELLGYRDREVTVEIGKQNAVRIGLARTSRSDPGYSKDYEGVGMQFDHQDQPDAGSGYFVTTLHPEGGARSAGVVIGDEIVAAAGVRADGVSLDDFLRQIKGADGTLVTLTVRRGGQVFDIHAVRRRLIWAPSE